MGAAQRFYNSQNHTLKSFVVMCCGHVNSNGKVLFYKSDQPWNSMHVSTYQSMATEYNAEIL